MAVLLLHLGQTLPMERLVDLLWEGSPPAQARRSVQAHVARLRARLHATGEPPSAADAVGVRIATFGDGYAAQGSPDAVDAHRFQALVTRAADETADRRLTTLQEALALWRGPALTDLATPSLRDRVCRPLEELRLCAAQERYAAELDLASESGAPPAALASVIAELRDFAATQPYRERVQALLMLALHRAGRRVEALAAFRALRDTLVEQLGVEPGEPVQRLHSAILVADPRLDRLPVGQLERLDALDALTTSSPPPVPGPSAGWPAAVVPRELPADVAGFSGRAEQLAALDAAAPIAVIAGTAGLGKTALAVHWAHGAADRFPDGQLYVNLQGYGPDPAVSPHQALGRLLRSLGVPADRVPAAEPDAAALYRSVLAGRRVLVVLDNARSAEQVRPLLPGARGCMAVVTSRDGLHGLVAAHGAHPIPLPGLTGDDARHLLGRRLGPDRVASEPDAVAEIVAGCARLPLALVVVAARAVARPDLPLSELAVQLRAARGGLDAFAGTDSLVDVRAVFSWSYRTLSAAAAGLFRLLALHPGPDVSLPGAASLAGLAPEVTRVLLRELCDAQLVTDPVAGRYAVHDLLRAYARELVHDVDTETEREAARRRMLDHYLQTGYSAARRLSSHREAVPPAQPLAGVTPERFTDRAQSLTWFTAEHPILLRLLDAAGEIGFDNREWQLAWVLMGVSDGRGDWRDWVAGQQEALAVARAQGDPGREAGVHRGLARAYALLGRDEEAVAHIGLSLELLAQVGDRQGQARVHLGIAWVFEWQERHGEALPHASSALELFTDVGHRPGTARALAALGRLHARLGRVDKTVQFCLRALAETSESGAGRAATCEELGQAYSRLGDHARAVSWYVQAVDIYRALGDGFYQAGALLGLGDAQRSAGETRAARAAWRQAAGIFEVLGSTRASDALSRLAAEQPDDRRTARRPVGSV